MPFVTIGGVMTGKIVVITLVAMSLSSCASANRSYVVSKSAAGITLNYPKVFAWGGSAYDRDGQMNKAAERHCWSMGKNSILITSDTSNPLWVTYTYACSLRPGEL